MVRPRPAAEALGQLVGIELHDRAFGARCRRIVLVVDQRRLELDLRRLPGRSRAGRHRTAAYAGKIDLDLVRTEHARIALGMPFHGQDGREALLIDPIGAAVSEEAVAARDPPLDQINKARALPTRGPEPGS